MHTTIQSRGLLHNPGASDRHVVSLHTRRSAGGPHVVASALRTADSSKQEAQQQQQQQPTSSTAGNAGDTSEATRRRRRRTTTSSQTPAADQQKQQQQPTARTKQQKRAPLSHYKLFQQQEAQQSSVRDMQVRPASSEQVSLPAGALSDPSEALNPQKKRGRRSNKTPNEPDVVEQQLLAQFEPFAQSFQQLAQQQQQQQQQQHAGRALKALRPAAAAAAAEAAWQQSRAAVKAECAADAEQQADSDQQQHRKRAEPGKTSRLIELFGVQGPSLDSNLMSVKRLDRETLDTLATTASPAKQAAQKLAQLLLQQQQQRKQQDSQQQPGQTDQQQPDSTTSSSSSTGQPPSPSSAAAAGSVDQPRPSRVLHTAVPQVGSTRIYVPAPSIAQATSAAERQPLRLLSIRQQQQLREEARQEAITKLRERTVWDYQQCLEQMLSWQGSGQRTYLPAPERWPVAVQLTWTTSSSSSAAAEAEESAGAAAEGSDAAASASIRQPDPQELAVLQEINAVVQKQLGQPLPDRAFRGERSVLLSSLAAAAVSERLKRWVSCCGKGFVAQLMSREPCLLGHEPQVLLKTLEALNAQLGVPTQDCVGFALKHVAVVGLDAPEMQARVQGLRDVLGYDWEQVVKLVMAQSGLLMLHPSHIQERLSAVARLLPEAAPKLPRVVLRSPFLLLKSPRALARSILELAEALGVSAWAASRLAAGQPSILSSNFSVLQSRLERLHALTAASYRWKQQLAALSPTALARCLTCSDSALDRLALLADVGAAGSPRLPPINLILTKPAEHFDALLAAEAERELLRQQGLLPEGSVEEEQEQEQGWDQQQQRRRREWVDTGAAAAVRGSSSGSASRSRSRASVRVINGKSSGLNGAAVSSSSMGGARSASAAAGSTRRNSSSTTTAAAAVGRRGAHHAASKALAGEEAEDDGDSVEGVLDSDRSWQSSLASALSQTAAAMRQVVVGVGVPEAAAAAAGPAGAGAGRSRAAQGRK